MNKKKIIITAAAGLISFGAAFVVSWFTKPTVQGQEPQLAQSAAEVQEAGGKVSEVTTEDAPKVTGVGAGRAGKATKEKQFEEFVYDVRGKIQEYNNRLRNLELTEQRLQVAQDALKKDIGQLNDLRVELAVIVASLKDERNKLLESRIKIAKTERENLVKIAATYDKMDPSSAGKILTNMSQMQDVGRESSFDDVVKILHYMTERTKAKLLAELVASEPKLAAVLCRMLKRIVEEE